MWLMATHGGPRERGKGVDVEREGEKRAKETNVTQRERKKERAEMKEPFLLILITFLLWFGTQQR